MTMLPPILAAVIALAAAPRPHVKYASPSDFTGIPRVVTKRLVAEQCRIPQSGARGPLINVASGHFLSLKRVDYAALCSRNGVSSVLVIDGRSGDVIARLNPLPDARHARQLDGHWLFDRTIDSISPKMPFCFVLDEPCPCSPTNLDGIADAYEKWAETHCWKNGWHTVVSGD